MIDSINNFGSAYFSPIIDGKNDNKPLKGLKIATYFTVIIPAAIALITLVGRTIKWISATYNAHVAKVNRVAQQRLRKERDVNEFYESALKTLRDIRDSKVEGCSDELFDVIEIPQETVEFMKRVKLEQIEFRQGDGKTFAVAEKESENFILFSDRDPSCGELRSHILREKLEEKQGEQGGDQKTLYEAISELLTSKSNSGLYLYWKSSYLPILDLDEATLDQFTDKLFALLQNREEVDVDRAKKILSEILKRE